MSTELVGMSEAVDLQAYEDFLREKVLRSRYQIAAVLADAISRSPMHQIVDRIIRRLSSGTWKMVDLRQDQGGHRRLARAYSGEAIVTRVRNGMAHRFVVDAVTACLLLRSTQPHPTVVEVGPAMPSSAWAATRLGRGGVYWPSCDRCAGVAAAYMPDLDVVRAERGAPTRGAHVIFTGASSAIPIDYANCMRSANEFCFRFDAGLVSLIGRLGDGIEQIEYAPAWPVELRQVSTRLVPQPEIAGDEGLSVRLGPHQMLDFSLFCEARGAGLDRVRIQDEAGVTRAGIGRLDHGFFAIDIRSGQAVGGVDGLKALGVLLDQFRDAGSPGPQDYGVRMLKDARGRCLLPTVQLGGA